jgi:hypothetical protein
MFTFSAQDSVPALPGAMNNFPHKLLWLSFHAIACSLPPEPNKRIFSGFMFTGECFNVPDQ